MSPVVGLTRVEYTLLGGRLKTSPERGVLATDEYEEPLIMAVRELDLDLYPVLEFDVKVFPLLEKVEEVPVLRLPLIVLPVRCIGVSSCFVITGGTGGCCVVGMISMTGC